MARVRASWARWPPDSLPAFCARVEAELAIRSVGQSAGPSPGWCGRRSAGGRRWTGRRRWACPARRNRPWPAGPAPEAGWPPEDLDRARRSASACRPPDLQQRRLAGAVRADEPDDAAGRDGQGAVGQRRASSVPLGQAVGLQHGRSCGLLDRWCGTLVTNKRLDALVVQPGRARLGQPGAQLLAQRTRAPASDWSARVRVTNVPTPGPRRRPGPRTRVPGTP